MSDESALEILRKRQWDLVFRDGKYLCLVKGYAAVCDWDGTVFEDEDPAVAILVADKWWQKYRDGKI